MRTTPEEMLSKRTYAKHPHVLTVNISIRNKWERLSMGVDIYRKIVTKLKEIVRTSSFDNCQLA